MNRNPEAGIPFMRSIAFAAVGAVGLSYAAGAETLRLQQDQIISATSEGPPVLYYPDIQVPDTLASLCLSQILKEEEPDQCPEVSPIAGTEIVPDKDVAQIILEQLPATTTTTTTVHKPPVTVPRPKPTRPPITAAKASAPAPVYHQAELSGNKQQWMAEAGVSADNFDEADYIFTKESGWRTDAVSPNGCIGIGQNCKDQNGNYWLDDACPNWRDQSSVVCQIRRFAEYAKRYGGWAGSANHKRKYGWW